MSGSQQPLAQLESLKYRITQIMDSITALQYLLDGNGQPVLPSWPDILAKYNLLLSQTHSLSVSLSSSLPFHQASQPQPAHSAGTSSQNSFQKLAIHPSVGVAEQQFDHSLAPLLRTQPTMQVLKEEDASVRRIATILKPKTSESPEHFEQVVRECTEIRRAHDSRVERAVKAVALLRDRYDWRARIDTEDLDKVHDEDVQEDVGKVDVLGSSNQSGTREEDVAMKGPGIQPTVEERDPSAVDNSPVSETDEANEAQEAEDVLVQGSG